MRSASATAGSSIVTIRPTMTRSPPSEPVGPAVVVGAGAPSAEHDRGARAGEGAAGDEGEHDQRTPTTSGIPCGTWTWGTSLRGSSAAVGAAGASVQGGSGTATY